MLFDRHKRKGSNPSVSCKLKGINIMILINKTELENKICTYCMNSLYKNEEIKEVYIPNKLKMLSTYNLKGRISDNTYKIECKEIFNKLNAPVYVWYDYKLFNNTVYAIWLKEESYKRTVKISLVLAGVSLVFGILGFVL